MIAVLNDHVLGAVLDLPRVPVRAGRVARMAVDEPNVGGRPARMMIGIAAGAATEITVTIMRSSATVAPPLLWRTKTASSHWRL